MAFTRRSRGWGIPVAWTVKESYFRGLYLLWDRDSRYLIVEVQTCVKIIILRSADSFLIQ